MQQHTRISVVDDDESVRESLPGLLAMLGFTARAFASAKAFLASGAMCDTQCLILDVAMPDVSGPELQSELHRRRVNIPIIFISGGFDGSLREALLARGAVACLSKPFTEEDLRSALAVAVGTA
jgi:FixJ family two-component response regulator